MENLKIRKGKTYTYEELKEIYNNAMMKTMDKPAGDNHKDDAKISINNDVKWNGHFAHNGKQYV